MAFALDKCSVPRHLALMLYELGVELSVRGSIELHTLNLAVFGTLVGVEESSRRGNISEGKEGSSALPRRGRDSPDSLGSIQSVGQTDPVSRGGLADTEVLHQRDGQDNLVQDVAGVDESLLGTRGELLPSSEGLLCGGVWADGVHVQVGSDAGRRDREDRVLVGRRGEGGRIVDDDGGHGVELGLDGGEQARDGLGVLEIGLQREVALLVPAACTLSRGDGDLVSVGSEPVSYGAPMRGPAPRMRTTGADMVEDRWRMLEISLLNLDFGGSVSGMI